MKHTLTWKIFIENMSILFVSFSYSFSFVFLIQGANLGKDALCITMTPLFLLGAIFLSLCRSSSGSQVAVPTTLEMQISMQEFQIGTTGMAQDSGQLCPSGVYTG